MEEGLDDPRLLRGMVCRCLVARSGSLGSCSARRLLGRDVCAVAHQRKALHCWRDLCIHRGAQLSLGRVCGELLVCPYHAWEYNSGGQCAFIPSQPGQPPPAKARAQTYAAREHYGMVWVCLGQPVGDPPQFAYGDNPALPLDSSGPISPRQGAAGDRELPRRRSLRLRPCRPAGRSAA